MTQSEYSFLVGIDWATEKHDVCVVDPQGEILAERTFEHSGQSLAQLVEWLLELADGQADRIAVAIEMTRGSLIETLADREIAVYAINPKQLDRFRDRHTVAGAKDDQLDAYVLADSLRTDRRRFRRLSIDDPRIIELREFSRMRDDLKAERNRLANRLREQIYRFFPQMLRLSPAADEAWFWALVELVPTPAKARTIRPRRITRLLQEYRIRRLSAEEILAQLRTMPVHVAPGTTEAALAHIDFLLPRLRLVDAQLKQNDKRLEQLLERIDLQSHTEEAADSQGQRAEHRDVDVILSVPGVGTIFTATMLAEASVAVKERDYDALRTHAGVAPVTRRSGKRKVVLRRHACNRRLAGALFHAARVHCQVDADARELYASLRARGHSHGRALRTVGDRLLSTLTAMLRSNTLWDPARRRRRVPCGKPLSAAA